MDAAGIGLNLVWLLFFDFILQCHLLIWKTRCCWIEGSRTTVSIGGLISRRTTSRNPSSSCGGKCDLYTSSCTPTYDENWSRRTRRINISSPHQDIFLPTSSVSRWSWALHLHRSSVGSSVARPRGGAGEGWTPPPPTCLQGHPCAILMNFWVRQGSPRPRIHWDIGWYQTL